jgi:hypothetical protein
MTDAETLDRARLLFVGDTQGDRLAREVIEIAERSRRQTDMLWDMITPLKDAVLFARSQRRPMGIGQDCSCGPASVRIELGKDYGRERDNAGFWINSDDVADSDSKNPCERIALALIRLAYSVAEKVKPQK